jgi:tetratricopeptide (TPR) repeat protein
MSQFRFARLALLLAALSLPLGTVYAADEAPKPETARESVIKPLHAANDLLKDKKYAEAVAKVAETDAIADKTPYELYHVNRTLTVIALNSGDNALLVKSAEAVINSGRLPAAEMPLFMKQLIVTHYNDKKYDKAIVWLERFSKEGFKDEQLQTILPQAYYFGGDYANAMRVGKERLAAVEQEGKVPTENQINFVRNCAVKLKDTASYNEVFYKLITYYPSTEYWDEVLGRVESSKKVAERLFLDLYRLRLATVQTLSEVDFKDMTNLSMAAVLPGEAKKVVDLGFTNGVLGVGPNAADHKKLRDKVTKAAADDLKSIAQGEASAAKSKEGTGLVNIGFAYVTYGQFDKGISLIDQGIKVGKLKQPEDAKLRLAEAYVLADKKAEAIATLNTITGGDGLPEIVKLWLIHLNKK